MFVLNYTFILEKILCCADIEDLKKLEIGTLA